MSAYSRNKTIYKDRDCLVEALGDMGYAKEVIELHEKAVDLIDYCGRKTHYLGDKDDNGTLINDRAHVIVRRKHVGGAANDLGFQQQKDGTYSAVVSAYDTSKHNASWMTDLKAAYGKAVINKTASKPMLVNGRWMKCTPLRTASGEIEFVVN